MGISHGSPSDPNTSFGRWSYGGTRPCVFSVSGREFGSLFGASYMRFVFAVLASSHWSSALYGTCSWYALPTYISKVTTTNTHTHTGHGLQNTSRPSAWDSAYACGKAGRIVFGFLALMEHGASHCICYEKHSLKLSALHRLNSGVPFPRSQALANSPPARLPGQRSVFLLVLRYTQERFWIDLECNFETYRIPFTTFWASKLI